MAKQQTPDYEQELTDSFARWDYLYEHGGQDPFWSDGCNLGLVRNHIIHYKREIEAAPLTLFGYPEIYYRETPPEVDPNYMAQPERVVEQAQIAKSAFNNDVDLAFLIANRDRLDKKAAQQICVDAVIGYSRNLESAIAENDLIAMRRYGRYEHYIESFKSCADKLRSILENQNEEEIVDNKITVLMVKPGERPVVTEIENDLKSLQAAVGGHIEVVTLTDSAVLICNENGKLENLPPNRSMFPDIIVGDFFICGLDGDGEFTSLSEEDIETYSDEFGKPEYFTSEEIESHIGETFYHL